MSKKLLTLLVTLSLLGITAMPVAAAAPLIKCTYLIAPADSSGVSKVLRGGCGANAFVPDSLTTTYTIAKFYDKIVWATLLITYMGSLQCSATVSYGVGALPTNLQDRFESGHVYNGCRSITVHQLVNFQGSQNTCADANCWTFALLNNHVRSWRAFY